MKKVLSILTITLLGLNLYSNEYILSLGEIKANIKNSNEILEPTEPVIPNTAQYSSCKDILLNYPEFLGQNGVYEATIDGQLSKLYCNMTDHGGGWTAVFSVFETDVITSWNQGVPLGYEPNLQNNVSFVLSTAQIPAHTEISFSHSNFDNSQITNIFSYQYVTGNIERTLITDQISGLNYHIHRNTGYYYAGSDPESSTAVSAAWSNSITIDRTGGMGYDFSFSPYAPTSYYRGIGYKGNRVNTYDAGSWLLFVR